MPVGTALGNCCRCRPDRIGGGCLADVVLDLEHALRVAAQRDLAGAWVTPASRFARGHWDAIAASWHDTTGA